MKQLGAAAFGKLRNWLGAGKVAQDITSENEITSGSSQVIKRDGAYIFEIGSRGLDSAASVITIRATKTGEGYTDANILYDSGIVKPSGTTQILVTSQSLTPLKRDDVIKVYITSDNPNDISVIINAKIHEVLL